MTFYPHNDNPKEVPMGHGKPEALITTPESAAWCPNCDLYGGVRHASDADRPTFLHCASCGSTDLFDCRSPFEVLDEARHNAADGTLDVETRWCREDVARRVAEVAAAADVDCCSDCARWARIVGVR